MNEASLLQAALVVPVAAAIFAMLIGDTPTGRILPPLLVAAAAASMAAAGALVATGTEIVWQGFKTDAWRSLLATGALAGSAAAMRHATGVRAAYAVGGGAAAASLVSPDILHVGLLLVLSSVAFAIGMVATPAASPLRRMRALVPLIASDALALAGLAAAAGTTLAFEPMSTAAGSMLLAAAALRLVPLPATAGDAMRAGATAVWFGPIRAQGALLAWMAVAGAPDRGWWLVGIGALGAAIVSMRLLRDAAPEAIVIVPGAIAAVGLGLGGPVAFAGAAITLAVAFAAVILLDASGEPALSSPLATFAPAGGALLGFGLAGGALWRVAAARVEFVPAALAIALAVALCAVAAWQSGERVRADLRVPAVRRTSRRVTTAALALPALAVAGLAAFAPAFTAGRAAEAIAVAAGQPPALVIAPENLAEGLGVAVALLALAGLLAGGVPRRTAPSGPAPPPPGWMQGWAAPLPAPRERSIRAQTRAAAMARPWTVVAAIGGAVAVVLAIRLILIAGGRGWL